jgi:hypothetical protein
MLRSLYPVEKCLLYPIDVGTEPDWVLREREKLLPNEDRIRFLSRYAGHFKMYDLFYEVEENNFVVSWHNACVAFSLGTWRS